MHSARDLASWKENSHCSESQRGRDKTSYRGSNSRRDDEADLYPFAATSVYLVISDYLVTLFAQPLRELPAIRSPAVFANIVFLGIDYS